MADRKALGIVEHENLFLCDLNEDKLPNLIFKDDIEHWNRHDYKNVIAFKDWESFCDWTYALHGLIEFYIHMGQMSREEALEILATPPLTDDEVKDLFSQVAAKLQISEQELMSYHDMPIVYRKYRNNAWAFKLGIKLYTLLGLDKRIRK